MLADAITPHSFFDYLQWGGIVSILVLALFGFFKEWWVFGSAIRREREEKLKWMELALRSTNLAENYANLRKERPL